MDENQKLHFTFNYFLGGKAHVGSQTLPDSIKMFLQAEKELEKAINTSGYKQNDTHDGSK